MIPPDDSLEALVDPWWVVDDGKSLCRGRLIRANLPHVMPEQAWLKVDGRNESTEHRTAKYTIETPLRVNEVKAVSKLPVAALPEYPQEVYLVQRAKVRPALVIGVELPELPKPLRLGNTGRWTNPTVLVAPSYGTGEGKSAPSPELMKRIRRCEYPNYFYIQVPESNQASIVRFDQMQPIGRLHQNYELTKYRLSDEALRLLDDWMIWLLTGVLPDGDLDYLRAELAQMP